MNKEKASTRSKKSDMFSNPSSLTVILPALVTLLVLLSAPQASGSWDMEIKNDIYFTKGGGSLSFRRSNTELTSQYITGEVEDYPSQISTALFWPYTSIIDTGTAVRGELRLPYSYDGSGVEDLSGQTTLGEEKYLLLDLYYAQPYGEDYPIGNWGGSSQVRFSASENNLEYWLNDLIINYGGFSYEGIFLLQKKLSFSRTPSPNLNDNEEVYRAGMELSVSGTKFSGVSLAIENWFGLEENPLELAGFNSPGTYGSGYLLTGDPGYQGTKVILRNLKLGPISFENETLLNITNGFEYTRFSTDVEPEGIPIEIDTSLSFREDSKTVKLIPSIVTEWGCIGVGTDIGFSESENSVVESISVIGLELTEVQLGNVNLDFVTSLRGNLLKRRDRTNLDLHAPDYLYDTPSQLTDLTETKIPKEFENFPLPFEETLYDSVLTLSTGTTDTSVDLDFYLSGNEGSAGLFDLGLVTGTLEKDFAKNLGFGIGVELAPEDGLQTFKFTTRVGF